MDITTIIQYFLDYGMDYDRLCREKGLADIVCFTGTIPNEEISHYPH